MKRLPLLLMVFGMFCFAQEHPAEHKTETAAAEHEGNPIWKWANFLLLAGGLGYLIRKNAGAFFDGRSQEIRKGITDAEAASADALQRVAAVDAKLNNMQADIAALKAEANREEDAESARVKQETAADIAKIQAHAKREIAAAAKAARNDLKRYSADLALQFAEQKALARMDPETDAALVRGFVRQLSN